MNLNSLKNLQDGLTTGTFELPLPTTAGINNWITHPGSRLKNQPRDMLEEQFSAAILFTVDSEQRISHLTNKFWLTSVQESRQEKAQIIETFGEPGFFFFGERTKIYNFTGTLLETKSTLELFSGKYLWSSSIVDFYDNHLRGTKLAEHGEEVLLLFKNMKLFGYITNFIVIHNSMSPQTTQFSFSMIIRKHDFVKKTTDFSILHDPNQYSENSVEMGNLFISIEELTESLNSVKPELVSRVQAKAKEIDDSRKIPGYYFNIVTSFINEHLAHMEKILGFKIDGIGEKFIDGSKDENTSLENIYKSAGTDEYLKERKILIDNVLKYNKLLKDAQRESLTTLQINT